MTRAVLVIDDDLRVQQTVGSILEDEGYQVWYARNGREALAQLERNPVEPALILLDLAMPEMDGYRFAEELAHRGLRSRIPLMVITADGRAPQKAARVGAAGYLAKPFRLEALLEQVQRLLPTDST